jgi:hypothetical protein
MLFTYLKANDNINFVHLFTHNLEFIVENIGDCKVYYREACIKYQQLKVLEFTPAASTDEVVTSLIDEPMEDPKEEENCQGDEFVDVKGTPKDKC